MTSGDKNWGDKNSADKISGEKISGDIVSIAGAGAEEAGRTVSERLTDRVSRYVDGETDAAESRALCDLFEHDAEARRRLSELLAVDGDVRERFDAMLEPPAPEALTRVVRDGFRRRRGFLRSGSGFTRGLGLLAASLLVLVGGSVVLTQWVDHRAQVLIAQEREAMRETLSQTVQRALETAESGHSVHGAAMDGALDVEVTPTRTFRSKSGHFCREFEELVPVGDAMIPRKSVACRVGEGVWKRVTTTIEGDVAI